MKEKFYVGMRVKSRFGIGKITQIYGGHDATIEIKSGHLKVARLRIHLNDLTPFEVQKTTPTSQKIIKKKSLPKQKLDSEQTHALKSLHSLRFGLVPHEVLPTLTYGFEEIENWVLKYLPKSPHEYPKILEVCGQYGTGKSHTMSAIRHIAKREGYMTARVEIDGKTISLSDPKTLLSSLWQTLNANGFNSTTPLLDIYKQAINNDFAPPHFTPNGSDRIYYNYKTIKLLKDRGLLDHYEEEFDAVLSCYDEITASELNRNICRETKIHCRTDNPKIVPMIGRSLAERPNDFIEALFGHGLVCQKAGFKGLVVTIDEFEIEYQDPKRGERLVALIVKLIDYITGKTDHRPSPVALFFATIPKNGEYGGDGFVDTLVKLSQGDCYHLEEMDLESINEIGLKIKALYYSTYNILEDETSPDIEYIWNNFTQGSSGKVRNFIKHYIAILDDNFGPPNYQ